MVTRCKTVQIRWGKHGADVLASLDYLRQLIEPVDRDLYGKAGSLPPPLPLLPGFVRRSGTAIGDVGQGLLPETPQDFF